MATIWLVQDGKASEATAGTRGQGDAGTDWILVLALSVDGALVVARAYDEDPDVLWTPEAGPYSGAREGVWNVWRWGDADGNEVEWIGCDGDASEAHEIARRCGGHQIQYGITGSVHGV